MEEAVRPRDISFSKLYDLPVVLRSKRDDSENDSTSLTRLLVRNILLFCDRKDQY